jgi:hypothetical protein
MRGVLQDGILDLVLSGKVIISISSSTIILASPDALKRFNDNIEFYQ